MESNLSSKNKIRDKIIDFMKKKYEETGIVPSIKEVNKKFNINLYTYFPEGIQEAYDICNFDFTPKQNKKKAVKEGVREKNMRFESVKEGRKRILEFFKQKIKEGNRPTEEEIKEKFNISLSTYFPGKIKELYELANVPLIGRLRDREELKEKIIKYVQSEAKKGHFPTYEEIDRKFSTNLNHLFSGIREVYSAGKIEYKRDPNPFVKYKKEKKLTEICKKIFSKRGYKIKKISIGPSTKGGPDIILEDKKNNLIPVEIKAYQKSGKLGIGSKYSGYFSNEITQIKEYMTKLNSKYGFLVSTANRKVFDEIPENIKLLLIDDIKNLLEKYNLNKEIEDLKWIRNTSVSISKEKTIKAMQEEILDYIRKKANEGEYASRKEIENKFRISLSTYFKNIKDAYKKAGVDINSFSNSRMGGNKINKKMMRNKIINFVKKEAEKNRFPTYKKIQKKFNCLLKSYFPDGIREIYREAGLKYNRKYASKTKEEKEEMRRKIIEFAKEKSRNNEKITYSTIERKFKINIKYYFEGGINEIKKKAGIKLNIK